MNGLVQTDRQNYTWVLCSREGLCLGKKRERETNTPTKYQCCHGFHRWGQRDTESDGNQQSTAETERKVNIKVPLPVSTLTRQCVEQGWEERQPFRRQRAKIMWETKNHSKWEAVKEVNAFCGIKNKKKTTSSCVIIRSALFFSVFLFFWHCSTVAVHPWGPFFFFFTVSHLLLLERRSQSVRKMQKRIQNGFASIGRQLDSTDSQKGYFSYIKI